MNLRQYIRGRRKGKAARDLEREALNDSFLNDAIDGYDAVPGDHSRRLENLHRKVSRSSLERSDFRRLAGLVAGLLVLLMINFFLNREDKTEMIAMDSTVEQAVPASVDTGTVSEAEAPPAFIAKAEKENLRVPSGVDKEKKVTDNEPAVVREDEEISIEESLLTGTDAMVKEEAALADEPVKKTTGLAMNRRMSAARPLFSATRGVSGIVTDESGNPIAGVAVQIKNSETGVVTGPDGKFVIPVSEKDSLQFSFIGFDTAIISPDLGSPMSVILSENRMALSESVVVGAGVLEPVTGWKEFRKYLKREMQYPSDTCRNVSGEVSLTFEIDKQGHPVNIKVRKPLCPSLDREAIRLLKEGPLWQGSAKTGQADIRFK